MWKEPVEKMTAKLKWQRLGEINLYLTQWIYLIFEYMHEEEGKWDF